MSEFCDIQLMNDIENSGIEYMNNDIVNHCKENSRMRWILLFEKALKAKDIFLQHLL